jgi:hypothetical protein
LIVRKLQIDDLRMSKQTTQTGASTVVPSKEKTNLVIYNVVSAFIYALSIGTFAERRRDGSMSGGPSVIISAGQPIFP